MTMKNPILIVAAALPVYGDGGLAQAEDGEHHLPHNHIAVIVGRAVEETADGHHENGNLWGIGYVRQFHERWGWGVAFEQEGFGENDLQRHGILAVPVSYFVNSRWRVSAGPGIEFREPGDPDKALFRVGTGYEFALGKNFAISPEVQVDFISGGTNVYVFALALGYGF
jgi:hypothetical protein